MHPACYYTGPGGLPEDAEMDQTTPHARHAQDSKFEACRSRAKMLSFVHNKKPHLYECTEKK